MCTTLLITGSAPISGAAEVERVKIEIDYNSAVSNANRITTYDVNNAVKVASHYGIENPEEVRAIKVTVFERESQSIPAPRSIYINNIQGPSDYCGAKQITKNSAVNQSNKTVTKNITLTGSVANTYSQSVEAGLAVDVA